MLRIVDLSRMFPLPYEALEARLGKFALVQRPPDPVLQKVATQLAHARTVSMAHRSRLAEQLTAMLHSFENFLVIGVGATTTPSEYNVGRIPTSQVVVQDPSASQRHAVLRWTGADGTCFVRDAGSTNGTFVNAREIYQQEVLLHDGDTLSFGDAHFLFLLTQTLHHQVDNARHLV